MGKAKQLGSCCYGKLRPQSEQKMAARANIWVCIFYSFGMTLGFLAPGGDGHNFRLRVAILGSQGFQICSRLSSPIAKANSSGMSVQRTGLGPQSSNRALNPTISGSAPISSPRRPITVPRCSGPQSPTAVFQPLTTTSRQHIEQNVQMVLSATTFRSICLLAQKLGGVAPSPADVTFLHLHACCVNENAEMAKNQ